MELTTLDIAVMIGFVACVLGLGMWKSRKEKSSEDYFLAGRGLNWCLIGFSLIAANISTEQFVGMSGQAADWLGLAIASYEWMAAITLVVVAFFFLPKFLRSGIFTIPEFLEYRYNEASRSIMALFTMIIYVGVTISAVIYSGAITMASLFQGKLLFGSIPINVANASWIIGILAAIYVTFGGLKACAWADLLQGSALIAGGAVVMWLAFDRLGDTPLAELAGGAATGITDTSSGWTKFMALNHDKLHMFKPITDPAIPWTALVLGLWIPNFYYWGLNQYIMQRTLGASSLGQGQKGIVFAAGMKLLIPFIIVFPGIIAFNLFSKDMAQESTRDTQIIKSNDALWQEFQSVQNTPPTKSVLYEFDEGFRTNNPDKAAQLETYNLKVKSTASQAGIAFESKHFVGYKYDTAFALLLGKLIPSGSGLQGFMLAAILGAVLSSLASMLNSASTIFTMDIYKKYMKKDASQPNLVFTGRFCVVLFTLIGCAISPLLGNPKFGGIFTYIQEFQGFISPGILAVFVFGLLVRKAPPITGVIGLLINPVMYGILKYILPGLSFLDRMAVSFFCVMAIMAVITAIAPMKVPFTVKHNTTLNMESSAGAKIAGICVVVATIILYIIFR